MQEEGRSAMKIRKADVLIGFLAAFSLIWLCMSNHGLQARLIEERQARIDQANLLTEMEMDISEMEMEISGLELDLEKTREESAGWKEKYDVEVAVSNSLAVDLKSEKEVASQLAGSNKKFQADLRASKRLNEELIYRLTPPSGPSVIGVMSGQNLYDYLNRRFPSAEYIAVGDDSYKIISVEEMQRFLDWDDSNESGYMSGITTTFAQYTDRFDCDDYAVRLAGSIKVPGWANVMLGIVWSTDPFLPISEQVKESQHHGGHAYNILVTMEGEKIVVYCIEPQSDEILLLPPAYKVYLIKFS